MKIVFAAVKKSATSTIVCLQVAAAFALSAAALGAVRSSEEAPATKTLPTIWEQAGPRERLKAVRAAELDGNRLLAERVFGIQVDGESTVYDLALQDDEVGGAVRAALVGAVTVGEPQFFDDGRVELVRAVRIQDVIERLNTVIKHTKLSSGDIKITTDTKRTQETREKNIDVQGNASLPGSKGQEKVMAKRAAEIDAYRKLAERIMGVEISGDTTVKNLATESDEIKAALAALLKGATPTAIQYRPDGTCEVTLEITYEDIIRTIKRHILNGREKVSIKDSVKTRTLSETGTGAPRERKKEDIASSSPPGVSEPFFDAKIVVEQVVASQPVTH
jgi:hypothetical protein